MLTHTLIRVGAWCGALSGLFIALPGAVEAFTGETPASGFVIGLSPALAAPFLVVLHLRQSREAGQFGTVAFLVNLIGLGLFGGAAFTLNMALIYLDKPVLEELLDGPTRLALLGSAVVFAVGAAMFGIAMVRARVYARLPAIAYAIGFPVFAAAAPIPDTPAISALHVVVGFTVVWLAADVRSTRVIGRTQLVDQRG